MEVNGLTCEGCGSTDVEFDQVTRKIHCNQCGREMYYSRARLGATGKVAFAKDNAIKFLKEGSFVEARKFSTDVLNMMQDNAAAQFIVAYCDEFCEGLAGSMSDYFTRAEPIPLEYDEVRDLIDLFESTLYNMRDFEVQMVSLVIANMQSMDDRQLLESFIDGVCPYCIARYASEDFMTTEREQFYQDIAANCDIPKTCLALLKGIKNNPGSPYNTGSFSMRGRTAHFLEHYVEPVGRIVQSMKPSQYKQKFLLAYQQSFDQFQSSMASGGTVR